jgi:hypothetical protein
MTQASKAMEAFGAASDQSNLGDSYTPDTPAYTGRLTFLRRIRRMAQSVWGVLVVTLSDILLEIAVSPPISLRGALVLRILFLALLFVLLIVAIRALG